MFRLVAPVPPSLTAKVPVIADAPRLTASLLDSKIKPPFAFVSTDNECATFSPDVAPVLVIPLPPVIVCTKLPVVCVPIVIKLFRLVAPVPPSLTAKVPVIADAPRLTASLLDSITNPPFVFASMDSV